MTLHESPSHAFAASLLELYPGPLVTILLKHSEKEYRVSKDLLCKQSKYFEQMLDGEFQKARVQQIPMDEEESFITADSVEMLLQWLYIGQVNFTEMDPGEKVGAIVNLVRLADMCLITGLDGCMTEELKAILTSSPRNLRDDNGRKIDPNTYYLTADYIRSAIELPKGHLIRELFADATVTTYLSRKDHKFYQEAEQTAFGGDLLDAIYRAMGKSTGTTRCPTIIDPLTERDSEWQYTRACDN